MLIGKLQRSALLASVAASVWSTNALAQSAAPVTSQVPFSIPRGELRTALQSFANQSRTEVIFSPNAVSGRNTRGVSGRMNPAEALRKLLAGTGFSFVQDSSGALLIRSAAQTRAPVAQARTPSQSGDLTAGGLTDILAESQELPETGVGQDIVVTAQRREQRAADVPISMNVFDRDTLESRRLNSVEDLAQLTPGLDVFAGNGTNNPTLTLRGVGTTNPFLNNNPSVATYVNDVYLPFSSYLTMPLYDVERIEVLKGPQVALYGRNATAGAINIITPRPSYELTGYADLAYGSFDYLEARAAVSGPVGDAARVRVAGIWQFGGGYMERPGTIGTTAGFSRNRAVPGVPAIAGEDGYGDRDVLGLRATLAWAPSSKVDVLFTAHYGRDNSELIGSTSINGDRVRAFMPPSAEPYVDYDNVLPRTDAEVHGLSAQISIDLGPATLTSVSGYNRIARDYTIGDFVPVRIAEASFDEKTRSLSQDLRLTFDGQANLTGTIGASYNDDQIDYSRVLVSYDFLLGALGTIFEEHDRAWALYGDGEWEFLRGWFLGAGLRYTNEDRDFDGGSFEINPFGVSRVRAGFPGLGPGGALFDTRSYDEDDLSGRIALNWRPHSGMLAYFSASRGFKSGGFDGSGITTPAGFDPYGSENVWAYEAGIKASPLNGLYVSAAGFSYDYSDKQVLALLDLGGGITEAVIQNAAAAEIHGIEAELRYRPVRGLAFGLNGTWLDSGVTRWVSADAAEIAARVGNELPGTPQFQLNASVDYDVRVGRDLMLTGALWANHTTGAYRDIENSAALRSETRTVINARVTLAHMRDGWSVYAFTENLLDERYVNSVRSLVGMLGNYYGAPRTAALGLRYDF